MDEVIIRKVQSIERCLLRIEEEYKLAGEYFQTNYTHRDAAMLNLLRACEQSIDLANQLIQIKKWEVPDSSWSSFEILIERKVLVPDLGNSLKKMVGFSYIVVHEYAKMNIKVVEKIIKEHLNDFRSYCSTMLKFTGFGK